MTDHPIVPSPELIQEWENKYEGHMPEWIIRHVAYEAAKWGADQELEACCNHIRNHQWGFIKHLNDDWIHRAVDLKQARRPKPPSLKEQALKEMDKLDEQWEILPIELDSLDTIRRALEQLDD